MKRTGRQLGAAVISLLLLSAVSMTSFAEVKTPTNDNILSSLVRIEERPDFAFRNDLDNSGAGESSPITEPYYLSAYKVTNAQYYEFISETSRKAPSYWSDGIYPEGKEDHPVLNVSYSDAVAYCE